MSTEALPRVVGLTGGIASGKSTVSSMFRDLGVLVIDADVVARDVVRPGSDALRDIEDEFGPSVILPSGELDRDALGKIIFSDPSARTKLNGFTHPRIAMEMLRQAAEAGAEGHPFVIYDAALIVENGLHHALGGLIVVAAAPEVQLARIQDRDGLSAEDAQKRIDAQLPLSKKIEVADWVIHNDGTLDETRAQVLDVFHQLRDQT